MEKNGKAEAPAHPLSTFSPWKGVSAVQQIRLHVSDNKAKWEPAQLLHLSIRLKPNYKWNTFWSKNLWNCSPVATHKEDMAWYCEKGPWPHHTNRHKNSFQVAGTLISLSKGQGQKDQGMLYKRPEDLCPQFLKPCSAELKHNSNVSTMLRTFIETLSNFREMKTILGQCKAK